MPKVSPDGLYCAYLRKSRRDEDLEALGHGETLKRHEKQLRELADRLGIRIAQWYREIVSGDTIAARPQVQQLLSAVNDGMWDGVLVMDVDRFGRGDSMDQGLIMQSLSYAGALVITPDKIYDPSDEADAEFFEIKLFFARREYNAIKKRMQRGRVAAVMDGCYLAPNPPYGYERCRVPDRKHGWSLRPIPEQAEIVRAVYTWAAYGIDGQPAGAARIAQRLQELRIKNRRGQYFSKGSVIRMLKNPTYKGAILWNRSQTQRRIVDGQRVQRRVASDHTIAVNGLHEAIVSPELWQRAQDNVNRRLNHPITSSATITNPLAGLVICDQCGYRMQRNTSTNHRPALISCPTTHCPTRASYLHVVETAILDTIRAWVRDFADAPAPEPAPLVDDAAVARAHLNAQISTLQAQLSRQYDALEQGIYTIDEFRRRRADITAKIEAANRALSDVADTPAPDPRRAFVPKIQSVLAAYDAASTPAEKNALLHTVIDHVSYHKLSRPSRAADPSDCLTLTVYPVIPPKND